MINKEWANNILRFAIKHYEKELNVDFVSLALSYSPETVLDTFDYMVSVGSDLFVIKNQAAKYKAILIVKNIEGAELLLEQGGFNDDRH